MMGKEDDFPFGALPIFRGELLNFRGVIIICRCVFLLETVDFHCHVSLLHETLLFAIVFRYELGDS